MKGYEYLPFTEYNGLMRGIVREEGKRLVRLIGFEKDKNGIVYGHWQFILKKTMKPSGKSTSFLVAIPEATTPSPVANGEETISKGAKQNTTDTEKHTPGTAEVYFNPYAMVSVNRFQIADCFSNLLPEETITANAERIVKCWNEYDSLRDKLAEVALKATGYEIKSEQLQEQVKVLLKDNTKLVDENTGLQEELKALQSDNEALKQVIKNWMGFIKNNLQHIPDGEIYKDTIKQTEDFIK